MNPDPTTASETTARIMEERAEIQQQVEAPTPAEDTTAAHPVDDDS